MLHGGGTIVAALASLDSDDLSVKRSISLILPLEAVFFTSALSEHLHCKVLPNSSTVYGSNVVERWWRRVGAGVEHLDFFSMPFNQGLYI